mmetsp:Transcript_14031/g.19393  ORF Transcript_14031/g.19393 Transcript_14031/m.19393 type:complete len:90 (-) Transcript_14031:412-681(-)
MFQILVPLRPLPGVFFGVLRVFFVGLIFYSLLLYFVLVSFLNSFNLGSSLQVLSLFHFPSVVFRSFLPFPLLGDRMISSIICSLIFSLC